MLRFEQWDKLAELLIDLNRSGRDDYWNSPNTYRQSDAGILFNRYVSVRAVAELSAYKIQYLRPILLSGKLEGINIRQIKPMPHM